MRKLFADIDNDHDRVISIQDARKFRREFVAASFVGGLHILAKDDLKHHRGTGREGFRDWLSKQLKGGKSPSFSRGTQEQPDQPEKGNTPFDEQSGFESDHLDAGESMETASCESLTEAWQPQKDLIQDLVIDTHSPDSQLNIAFGCEGPDITEGDNITGGDRLDPPGSGMQEACTLPPSSPRDAAASAGVDIGRTKSECMSVLGASARALKSADYDTAIRLSSQVLEQGQACAAAYYIRSECYRLKGELTAAVEDMGFCLALDTFNGQAHYRRGAVLLELGRFAQAAHHLRLSLRHNCTQRCLALVCLGRCLEELGDSHPALAHYDAAIMVDASSAYAHFCRGRCCKRLGDSRRAAQDMEQALLLDPAFVDSYLRRAAEAERRGDSKAALKLYTALEAHLPLPQEQRASIAAARQRLSNSLQQSPTVANTRQPFAGPV